MVTNMSKREEQMRRKRERANTSGLNSPYIKRTDPELNISVLPHPQSEEQSVEYELCFKTHLCFPIHSSPPTTSFGSPHPSKHSCVY